MKKEDIKGLFEEQYVTVFGKQFSPVWDATYKKSLEMKIISEEMFSEYDASGLTYVESKVDLAWKLYMKGFLAGTVAEFSKEELDD